MTPKIAWSHLIIKKENTSKFNMTLKKSNINKMSKKLRLLSNFEEW